MKVLAVDDSTSILELIKATLTPEGIEVETAENGADALTKYAKFQPDVVTLDVSMPIMDGIETLNRLLKLDPNAKIVMVTVEEHWSLIERCIERGAIGYLAKPFDIIDLVDTVKDPWAFDDKTAIVLLSLSCNRISASFRKLFKTEVSARVGKIEIIRQDQPYISPNGGNVAQIMVVPTIVAEPEINPPAESTGYVTQFVGQQNGMILSFIKDEDLQKMVNMSLGYYGSSSNPEDIKKEFFNAINNKILSTVVDLTRLVLNAEVPRPFDENIDHAGKKAIKSHVTLRIGKLVTDLELQIWNDLREAFRRRF